MIKKGFIEYELEELSVNNSTPNDAKNSKK